MNERPIEIEFEWKTRDLWRISLDYFVSFRTLFGSFRAFALFGIFITFLFLRGEAQIAHFIDVILFSMLFSLLFGLARSYISVVRGKELGRVYKYRLTDERLEILTADRAGALGWKSIVAAKEIRNYFIFTIREGQKLFLPKRCFRDDEKLNECKKLLRSRLGRRLHLKKSKESLGLR